MVKIKTNVYHTQAKATALCIHVGSVAFYIGKKGWPRKKIQILTPCHRFKLSNI